ncbi:MAG TPA: putative sporulation protein YtxC [Bacillus bacterium]|nr:putative sporulation protein YtxC [Bacillus sp. (in: firmicutes)]
MITIQFREKKDAVLLFQLIKEHHHPNSAHVQVNIIYEPEVLVKINFKKSFDSIISTVIIPVIMKYIIKIVEVNWMKEMISNMFYFTDMEEQRQIMSIARSIIDGEKAEMPVVTDLNDHLPREKMIENSLRDFLTTSVSFSFEAFLQFRLKEYRIRLLQYIEAAIDEYKLEQEYQNFVENLRSYVYNKDSLMEIIHLVYEEDFRFFDRNLNEIGREQLTYLIDEQLIKIEDIDTDSLVIAPLISIAPRTVYLYTDRLDHGLIQTIQNIFLERAELRSQEAFQQLKGQMFNM